MKLLKRTIYAVTASAILFFTGCYNTENAGGVNPGVTANEVEISIDIPGAGVTRAMGSDTNVDTLTIKAYTFDETTYLTVYAGEGTLTRVLDSTGPDIYKWKGNISVSAVGNIMFCARAFDSESKMLYCGQASTTVVDGYNTVTIIGMKTDYDLQEVGPAGGLIFYIETDTDQIIARGWKYLEVAPADITVPTTTFQWKTTETTTGGTSTDFGTGYDNTYTYMTGPEHPAAEACRNYGVNGFNSGWFLPSDSELVKIWDNLVNDGSDSNSFRGGFTVGTYLSSSEYSAEQKAFGEIFSPKGNPAYPGKLDLCNVRAVRAFQ